VLEPEDIDAGAQIAAGTPDGLYVYQADERLKSGLVLQADVQYLAYQAAGDLGVFVTDVEDDLANQILNSFANDWSDKEATESDKWKLTKNANAVSPQNLMFYDAPLYGYSEPLIYRSERFEEITVYKWKLVSETGKISGTVKFQGEYIGGADVQITSSQPAHTNGQGYYILEDVPVGDVIVEAQKVIDGVLVTAQVPTEVVSNQTTHVDIELKRPAHFFRRVFINGSQRTEDYQIGWAPGWPINDAEINGVADLDPGTAKHVVKLFDCIGDGNVLGRLILSFDLNSDDSVTVKTTIRCYCSPKPDTDDYDEASLDPYVLKAGWHRNWYIFVDGRNRASAYFTLRNETNQS
jgi:hypothetical protein